MNKNIHRLKLEIRSVNENECTGLIKKDQKEAGFTYKFENRSLIFSGRSKSLIRFLEKNIYQVRGIFQSKRADTFFPGFLLDFSVEDNFSEPDPLTHLCVIDKTSAREERYYTGTGKDDITEVYCDGCYLPKKKCGGIAVLIKTPDGTVKIISEQLALTGSNEAELMAAIRALELSRQFQQIRLISDSRYVRKGLSKWLVHWKLNNWRTSNAESPKNIELWQYIDQLTEGRYVEFKWVKGHQDCQENIICDREAKKAAGKNIR